MVTMYVDGKAVGVWLEPEALCAELARSRQIELRDDSGKVLGRVIPEPAPIPSEPLVPWDATITREELDRRAAEPGFSLEEMRKRLGWV